jgi:hypothetical protein
MAWFAHISERGPIKQGMVMAAINVISSPTDFRPIGLAISSDWTDGDRLAIWTLEVDGEKIPGRFTILDGMFIPLDDDARHSDESLAGETT